jgi:ATP-binding cassette subfamily B (MDR/TAP) protein 1
MAWFDQEENESARISARLALDANNVRSAIGDRISVIVQNTALMLVACTAGFVLQWRLALVLIAVFPVVVAATVLQVCFITFSFRHSLYATLFHLRPIWIGLFELN